MRNSQPSGYSRRGGERMSTKSSRGSAAGKSRSPGIYTSSGTQVRNASAYAATGAPTFTKAGREISNPVAYSNAVYSNATKPSGIYTSSGTSVRNASAYASTGAPTYTKVGRGISNPVAYSNAIEARVRQNTERPKYLYHYTNDESARMIEQSGRIRASAGPGDCALGEGVYMTAKPPRTSTDSLLENNYAGAGRAGQKADRADAYVRVDADQVRHSGGRGKRELGRNVFVVPGDLDLAGAGAYIGKRY